ncbi:hypothetical protein MHC_02465 [Mycoplasma haemocanis str. Illinois]|uniref:Uncharacterized protein n=1 Tax=Mycoplasma haemocanis (strain Illinois) TaxID=1111676 RepID=H6N6T5_MYCHN|nr:hypothetical protein [Mycoplasma haemocanis]AEW45357.2 hypothetical protein MHC_02465 [Mycoplasma haemocanis str. Illinois]
MILSTVMKSLLGGSLLAVGVGLGIDKAIFFPEDSNSKNFVKTSSKSSVTNPFEEESQNTTPHSEPPQTLETKSETIQAEVPKAAVEPEKKCTIYKILSSSKKTASLTDENFLDKQVKKQSKTYQEIKNACAKDKEKKIYLSWENVGWFLPRYEWVYNQSKQNIDWQIIEPDLKK